MPIPTYDTAQNFPSDEVLDEYSSPPIPIDPRHSGGVLKVASGKVNTANTQDERALRFFSLPTNACIKEIRMFHKDATTADADVGFYYQMGYKEGAAVDDNAIANGMTLNAARRGRVVAGAEEFPVDLTFGGGVSTLDNVNKQLWEWIGSYLVDPQERWDLVVTPRTAPGNASITIVCYYTDGS